MLQYIGKSIEKKKDRKECVFVRTPEDFNRRYKLPNCDSYRIISENLVIMFMVAREVLNDRGASTYYITPIGGVGGGSSK